MIDINIYRSQIGLFSPKFKKKSVFKNHYFIQFWWNSNNSGKKTLSLLRAFCKLVMILVLVYPYTADSSCPKVFGQPPPHGDQGQAVRHNVKGVTCYFGGGSQGVHAVDVPGNDHEWAVDPGQVFYRQAYHFDGTGGQGLCVAHTVQDQSAGKHATLCIAAFNLDEGGGELAAQDWDVLGGATAGYAGLQAVQDQVAEGPTAHCCVGTGRAQKVQVVVHTERLEHAAALYWGATGRVLEAQHCLELEGHEADCLGARGRVHGVQGHVYSGALSVHYWVTSRAPGVLYCRKVDGPVHCLGVKGRDQGDLQSGELASQDQWSIQDVLRLAGHVQALVAEGHADHHIVPGGEEGEGLDQDGELATHVQDVVGYCGLCKKIAGEDLSETGGTITFNSSAPFNDRYSWADSEIINHNFRARYLHGNIQKSKGILNMHLNIRSLRHKVYEIKQIVKESNPTLIGLSECELTKDRIDEKSLKVPGYSLLYPKSWAKHGYARVVVYIKETFKYQQISELEDESVQSVWIKGSHRNSKDILFCHGYREHLTGQGAATQQQYLATFLGQWEAATQYGVRGRSEPNEVHICGDMNIDTYKDRWLHPNYYLVTLSRMIKSVCDQNNFHQLVKDITRLQINSVTNTTSVSTIDHVYTNTRFRCSAIQVTSFGDSDHDLVSYTRYSKNPPVPARIICKRSYKNFDSTAFLNDIGSIDWSEVYASDNVDEATECLTRKFRYVLNVHAPWVRIQQRKSFCPWITAETKQLIKQRDAWKQRAKDLAISSEFVCQAQALAWEQFKLYRNRINNRKKSEENRYKSEKILEVADSPDLVWKNAKNFMGWKSQGTPTQLKVGNELITSAKRIANVMNIFFLNKVETIRQGILSTCFNLSKVNSIMVNKACSLQLKHVSLSKVNKTLKSLSNSKSTGIDELDNFSVKLAADLITQPVHHVLTLSIMSCQFPQSWKYSKVIPLHKKEDVLEAKNYRPVAILSPISKIMEKIIYEEIYDYFAKNSLFHPSLHGYRKHRSTQTALLQMYNRWIQAASDSKLSAVVLLDLSAAFDLVDPDLLLQKLQVYGFKNDILSFVKSYLTNRYQAVWVDHALSEFLPCPVGVPQGSNLGPLLFLIFYNDLPYLLDCAADAYADDTTLTVTGDNITDISEKMTSNCELVTNWMKGNKLKLNATKTHLLTVGTSERLRLQVSPVVVRMDGYILKESEDKVETLLGVEVEPTLKWHRQVQLVVAKLKKRLTGLASLSCILPFNLRKRVSEGIFTSVLVYCLPLFGGCEKYEMEALQIMQNKAARLLTHSNIRTKRKEMFAHLDWLTVNQLVFYHTVLAIFRIRTSKEPEYLHTIMSRDNRAERIIIPNTTLTLAKKSFCYRGAAQWNSLPPRIRNTKKIGLFKTQVRGFIKTNVPQFIQ